MKYSQQKKTEALESIAKVGVPATHKEMGITTATLYKWKNEAMTTMDVTPMDERVVAAVAAIEKDESLRERIAELEAEVGRLIDENRKVLDTNAKLRRALMVFVGGDE